MNYVGSEKMGDIFGWRCRDGDLACVARECRALGKISLTANRCHEWHGRPRGGGARSTVGAGLLSLALDCALLTTDAAAANRQASCWLRAGHPATGLPSQPLAAYPMARPSPGECKWCQCSDLESERISS